MVNADVTSRSVQAFPGGNFLIANASPAEIFTPEDFTDEQRQIAQTTTDFAEKSVLPHTVELEAKNFEVTRKLILEAGSLGLLAVDVPEEFGGLNLDKVTSALIADRIATYASFSVAFSAHTGIGTLPLVWYGSAEQKKKYLPRLASGEWVAAYALSEAGSGSDAMNITARASLSEDGKHYTLNGEKMWTSNAGLAGLFTVFAKIDGEKFTAFLVEAGTPGLTIGKEEHKMGIRGSSTCPLSFSNCRIPAENLLGKAGEGHHIAFNILNVGRYKLGAAAVGASRFTLREAVSYAGQRTAFGKPISSFGLIQEKLAEWATLIFAGEALVYRVVGEVDAALAGLGSRSASAETGKRIGEYAMECSAVKVWCSEMLDTIVDHNVQIHGGYGYVEDYPVERGYRDARINRIFEGTNEINRLVISGWTLKRASEGRLALLPAMRRVMDDLVAGPGPREEAIGILATEKSLLSSAKRLFLFTAGAASEKYPTNLAEQQEIMGALADMIMELLVMESALLRAEKMANQQSGARSTLALSMARYYQARSFRIIEEAARKILPAVTAGDAGHTTMAIFRRLTRHDFPDTIALGRSIAAAVIAAGRYPL